MRYFFDVRSINGIAEDPDGLVLSSDQKAIEAAKREALGLAADYLRDCSPMSPRTIVIRSGGRRVAEIDISTVVKDFLG